MRPPHYTGENHIITERDNNMTKASMRPPHYTGENVSRYALTHISASSFNEAPALHGGKQVPTDRGSSAFCGFNEAPALHGGKLRYGQVPCENHAGFNEAPALHGGKL